MILYKQTFLRKIIASVMVCLFLVNDIAWANPQDSFHPTLKTTTLAPALRLSTFLKGNDLDPSSDIKVAMAAVSLRKLIIEQRNDDKSGIEIIRKINKLNRDVLKDCGVVIDPKLLEKSLSSGKIYKYLTFRFKKDNTDKQYEVAFLNDHDNLTDTERAELGIRTKEDIDFLNCPGLEGVWFKDLARDISSRTLPPIYQDRGILDFAWGDTHDQEIMCNRAKNARLFVLKKLKEWASEKPILKGLNLGSGRGAFSSMLEQAISGLSIIDLDIASPYKESLRRGKFAQADTQYLPIELSSQDFIIATFLLNYIDAGKTLEEMRRVLKREGRVILILHNPNSSMVLSDIFNTDLRPYNEQIEDIGNVLRWLTRMKAAVTGTFDRQALSTPFSDSHYSQNHLDSPGTIQRWLALSPAIADESSRKEVVSKSIDMDIHYMRNLLRLRLLHASGQNIFKNIAEIRAFFEKEGFKVAEACEIEETGGGAYAFGIVLDKGKNESISSKTSSGWIEKIADSIQTKQPSRIKEEDRLVFSHYPNGEDITKLDDAKVIDEFDDIGWLGGICNTVTKDSGKRFINEGTARLTICLKEIEGNALRHGDKRGLIKTKIRLYKKTGILTKESYVLQCVVSQNGVVGDKGWQILKENLRGYMNGGPAYLMDNGSIDARRKRGVAYSSAGGGLAHVGNLMELTPVVLEYKKSETGLQTTLWVDLEGLFEKGASHQAALGKTTTRTTNTGGATAYCGIPAHAVFRKLLPSEWWDSKNDRFDSVVIRRDIARAGKALSLLISASLFIVTPSLYAQAAKPIIRELSADEQRLVDLFGFVTVPDGEVKSMVERNMINGRVSQLTQEEMSGIIDGIQKNGASFVYISYDDNFTYFSPEEVDELFKRAVFHRLSGEDPEFGLPILYRVTERADFEDNDLEIKLKHSAIRAMVDICRIHPEYKKEVRAWLEYLCRTNPEFYSEIHNVFRNLDKQYKIAGLAGYVKDALIDNPYKEKPVNIRPIIDAILQPNGENPAAPQVSNESKPVTQERRADASIQNPLIGKMDKKERTDISLVRRMWNWFDNKSPESQGAFVFAAASSIGIAIFALVSLFKWLRGRNSGKIDSISEKQHNTGMCMGVPLFPGHGVKGGDSIDGKAGGHNIVRASGGVTSDPVLSPASQSILTQRETPKTAPAASNLTNEDKKTIAALDLPKRREHIFDFPLHVVADADPAELTDDILKERLKRLRAWPLISAGHQEMVRRTAQSLGPLAPHIAAYCRGVLGYEPVSISCYGSYLWSPKPHDLDILIIVKGKVAARVDIKDLSALLPKDMQLEKGAEKISLCIIGQDALERNVAPEVSRDAPLDDSPGVINSIRTRTYYAQFVFWGRDLAETPNQFENNLAEAARLLIVAHENMNGTFSKKKNEDESFRKSAKRLMVAATLLKYLSKQRVLTRQYRARLGAIGRAATSSREDKIFVANIYARIAAVYKKVADKVDAKQTMATKTVCADGVVPPPGSPSSVFEYLCKKDITTETTALTGEEIAREDGELSYDHTIIYDIRALRHLGLITPTEETRNLKEEMRRYYVPESVKKKMPELMPILDELHGKRLRPSKKALEAGGDASYMARVQRVLGPADIIDRSRVSANRTPAIRGHATASMTKEEEYYQIIIDWARYVLEHYNTRFGGGKLIFIGGSSRRGYEAARILAPNYGVEPKDIIYLELPRSARIDSTLLREYLAQEGVFDGTPITILDNMHDTGSTLDKAFAIVGENVKKQAYLLYSNSTGIASYNADLPAQSKAINLASVFAARNNWMERDLRKRTFVRYQRDKERVIPLYMEYADIAQLISEIGLDSDILELDTAHLSPTSAKTLDLAKMWLRDNGIYRGGASAPFEAYRKLNDLITSSPIVEANRQDALFNRLLENQITGIFNAPGTAIPQYDQSQIEALYKTAFGLAGLTARDQIYILHPGIATRIENFISFIKEEGIDIKNAEPQDVIRRYSEKLGNARVYRALVLSREELGKLHAAGSITPASTKGCSAADARELIKASLQDGSRDLKLRIIDHLLGLSGNLRELMAKHYPSTKPLDFHMLDYKESIAQSVSEYPVIAIAAAIVSLCKRTSQQTQYLDVAKGEKIYLFELEVPEISLVRYPYCRVASQEDRVSEVPFVIKTFWNHNDTDAPLTFYYQTDELGTESLLFDVIDKGQVVSITGFDASESGRIMEEWYGAQHGKNRVPLSKTVPGKTGRGIALEATPDGARVTLRDEPGDGSRFPDAESAFRGPRLANTLSIADVVSALLNDLRGDHGETIKHAAQALAELRKAKIISAGLIGSDIVADMERIFLSKEVHDKAIMGAFTTLIKEGLIDRKTFDETLLAGFLLKNMDKVDTSFVACLETLIEKGFIDKQDVKKYNVIGILTEMLRDTPLYRRRSAADSLGLLKDKGLISFDDDVSEKATGIRETITILLDKAKEASKDCYGKSELLAAVAILIDKGLVERNTVAGDISRLTKDLLSFSKEGVGEDTGLLARAVKFNLVDNGEFKASNMAGYLVEMLFRPVSTGWLEVNNTVFLLVQRNAIGNPDAAALEKGCVARLRNAKHGMFYARLLAELKKRDLIENKVVAPNILSDIITDIESTDQEIIKGAILVLEELLEGDLIDMGDLKKNAKKLQNCLTKTISMPPRVSVASFAATVLSIMKKRGVIGNKFRIPEEVMTSFLNILRNGVAYNNDWDAMRAINILIKSGILTRDETVKYPAFITEIFKLASGERDKIRGINTSAAEVIGTLAEKGMLELTPLQTIADVYNGISLRPDSGDDEQNMAGMAIRARVLLPAEGAVDDLRVIGLVAKHYASFLRSGGTISASGLGYNMCNILLDKIAVIAAKDPRLLSEDIVRLVASGFDRNNFKPASKDKFIYDKSLEIIVNLALNGEETLAKIAADCIEAQVKEEMSGGYLARDKLVGPVGLILAKRAGVFGNADNMYKFLRDAVRLEAIFFADGGNAETNYSVFAEEMLRNSKPVEMKRPPGKVPILQDISDKESKPVRPASGAGKLLDGCEIVKVLGRTAVYKKPDGRYIALKMLKEGEDVKTLVFESKMLEYLNKYKAELGLASSYPKPVLVDGHRALELKEIPQYSLSAKDDAVRPAKNIAVKMKKGFYAVMAYEAESAGYFTYLNDAAIGKDAFEAACLSNIHDLFTLAQYGIIHTALIELFHNLIQRGREDRGRYLWMVDILRHMQTRSGAGRVHAWTEAVRYTNARLSGIADTAEFATLPELMNAGDERSVHLTTFLNNMAVENPANFYLANYLGDYLMSISLITAKRFRELDLLNWEDGKNVDALADTVRRQFKNAYVAFTGKDDRGAADMIDWKMLARQMSFFMEKNDTYARYLLGSNIPPEIYGKDVEIHYSGDLEHSRGWIDKDGNRGWYFDGENPDLGPVNGANPLTELVKALYVYTSFMIAGSEPTSGRTQKDPLPVSVSMDVHPSGGKVGGEITGIDKMLEWMQTAIRKHRQLILVQKLSDILRKDSILGSRIAQTLADLAFSDPVCAKQCFFIAEDLGEWGVKDDFITAAKLKGAVFEPYFLLPLSAPEALPLILRNKLRQDKCYETFFTPLADVSSGAGGHSLTVDEQYALAFTARILTHHINALTAGFNTYFNDYAYIQEHSVQVNKAILMAKHPEIRRAYELIGEICKISKEGGDFVLEHQYMIQHPNESLEKGLVYARRVMAIVKELRGCIDGDDFRTATNDIITGGPSSLKNLADQFACILGNEDHNLLTWLHTENYEEHFIEYIRFLENMGIGAKAGSGVVEAPLFVPSAGDVSTETCSGQGKERGGAVEQDEHSGPRGDATQKGTSRRDLMVSLLRSFSRLSGRMLYSPDNTPAPHSLILFPEQPVSIVAASEDDARWLTVIGECLRKAKEGIVPRALSICRLTAFQEEAIARSLADDITAHSRACEDAFLRHVGSPGSGMLQHAFLGYVERELPILLRAAEIVVRYRDRRGFERVIAQAVVSASILPDILSTQGVNAEIAAAMTDPHLPIIGRSPFLIRSNHNDWLGALKEFFELFTDPAWIKDGNLPETGLASAERSLWRVLTEVFPDYKGNRDVLKPPALADVEFLLQTLEPVAGLLADAKYTGGYFRDDPDRRDEAIDNVWDSLDRLPLTERLMMELDPSAWNQNVDCPSSRDRLYTMQALYGKVRAIRDGLLKLQSTLPDIAVRYPEFAGRIQTILDHGFAVPPGGAAAIGRQYGPDAVRLLLESSQAEAAPVPESPTEMPLSAEPVAAKPEADRVPPNRTSAKAHFHDVLTHVTEAMPAIELFHMLDIASANVLSDRSVGDAGDRVFTLELPPHRDSHDHPKDAGDIFNKREGTYDLWCNKAGLPMALFHNGSKKYIDITAFSFEVPHTCDPDAAAKWHAHWEECLRAGQLIDAYKPKGSRPYATKRGYYYYLEVGDESTVRAIPFEPGMYNPEKWGADFKRRHAIVPRFPSVYSPDALADGTYHTSIIDNGPKFSIQKGHAVLVVGPGTGIDTWLASLKTDVPIHVIGINPFEVANVRAAAKINGFNVVARVYDSIADEDGSLAFAGPFDRILWNMPYYLSDVPAKTCAEDFTLWDGDIRGASLIRFAKFAHHILKRNGKILIWNFADTFIEKTFTEHGYSIRAKNDGLLSSVYIVSERRKKIAPPGSPSSVFEYLCKKDITTETTALTGEEIAREDGELSYDHTIIYDIRALRHLGLITPTEETRNLKEEMRRYYVPESVKKKMPELMPILDELHGKRLRPSKKALEAGGDASYMARVRRVLAPAEVAGDGERRVLPQRTSTDGASEETVPAAGPTGEERERLITEMMSAFVDNHEALIRCGQVFWSVEDAIIEYAIAHPDKYPLITLMYEQAKSCGVPAAFIYWIHNKYSGEEREIRDVLFKKFLTDYSVRYPMICKWAGYYYKRARSKDYIINDGVDALWYRVVRGHRVNFSHKDTFTIETIRALDDVLPWYVACKTMSTDIWYKAYKTADLELPLYFYNDPAVIRKAGGVFFRAVYEESSGAGSESRMEEASRLIGYYKKEYGDNVISVDVRNAAEVAARAVDKGIAVIGLASLLEEDNPYKMAELHFSSISDELCTRMGVGYENDYRIAITEILKNAFAHGNNGFFDVPIILECRSSAQRNSIIVTDAATSCNNALADAMLKADIKGWHRGEELIIGSTYEGGYKRMPFEADGVDRIGTRTFFNFTEDASYKNSGNFFNLTYKIRTRCAAFEAVSERLKKDLGWEPRAFDAIDDIYNAVVKICRMFSQKDDKRFLYGYKQYTSLSEKRCAIEMLRQWQTKYPVDGIVAQFPHIPKGISDDKRESSERLLEKMRYNVSEIARSVKRMVEFLEKDCQGMPPAAMPVKADEATGAEPAGTGIYMDTHPPGSGVGGAVFSLEGQRAFARYMLMPDKGVPGGSQRTRHIYDAQEKRSILGQVRSIEDSIIIIKQNLTRIAEIDQTVVWALPEHVRGKERRAVPYPINDWLKHGDLDNILSALSAAASIIITLVDCKQRPSSKDWESFTNPIENFKLKFAAIVFMAQIASGERERTAPIEHAGTEEDPYERGELPEVFARAFNGKENSGKLKLLTDYVEQIIKQEKKIAGKANLLAQKFGSMDKPKGTDVTLEASSGRTVPGEPSAVSISMDVHPSGGKFGGAVFSLEGQRAFARYMLMPDTGVPGGETTKRGGDPDQRGDDVNTRRSCRSLMTGLLRPLQGISDRMLYSPDNTPAPQRAAETPALPASEDDALKAVKGEIERIRIENLDHYPAIPKDKTLCHIVTDSILPLAQRGILQDLKKGMQDASYREKVIGLSFDKDRSFAEQVREAAEKAVEYYGGTYEDYIFDVACPGTVNVEEALTVTGVAGALAFEPCGEAEIAVVQVEGIMLALRALERSIDAKSAAELIRVYEFLTHEKCAPDTDDVLKVAKRMLFRLPASAVKDTDEIRTMNALIARNILTAA